MKIPLSMEHFKVLRGDYNFKFSEETSKKVFIDRIKKCIDPNVINKCYDVTK